MGHLTSLAFPILGNLTKNLGSRVGTFAFLHGGIKLRHVVPCAHLCAGHMGYGPSVRSRWLDIGQVLFLRVYGLRRSQVP